MLISEFARATELSVDTVRFYIKRGLLTPEVTSKGGRHPYQSFTDDHVRDARMIRMGQSLGMSLKQISSISEEVRTGGLTRERMMRILRDQLDLLDDKASELKAMSGFLRAKLTWLENGEQGKEPDFFDYVRPPSRGKRAKI